MTTLNSMRTEIGPDFAEVYCDRGIALDDRGEYDSAILVFDNAIDLKPDYATGHQWYSEFLSTIGRHEEAIAEAKKAYELEPLSIIMPIAIASAYERARHFDEAITWYEKALAQSPELKRYFLDFGFCYLGKGDEQRAVQKWQDWYSWQEEEALADRLGEAPKTAFHGPSGRTVGAPTTRHARAGRGAAASRGPHTGPCTAATARNRAGWTA